MVRKAAYPASKLVEYCKEHGRAATMQHFGCGRSTLDNALHLYGVAAPSLSAIRRQQHLQWIEENNPTLLQATQHFNCSINYIKHLCQAAGITLRTASAAMPVSMSNFDILRMLICGHTQGEVATEQCVSRQRVSQVYKIAEQAGLLGKQSFIQPKPETPSEECGDGRVIYRPDGELKNAS